MKQSTPVFPIKMPCFHLNVQILADTFEGIYQNVFFQCKTDPARLDGVRLYQKDKPLQSCYIYLLHSFDVTDELQKHCDISFLVTGSFDFTCFSSESPVLSVGTDLDFPEIFTVTQQAFEKYQTWDRNLHIALNSRHPLDDMAKASLDVFENPIMIHDTHFNILSCPRHLSGMFPLEKDQRTGRNIISLSLIHDFKTDLEYLETLSTKGSQIYSAELRGFRILYRNLWVEDRYEGRICIDELQSALFLGQHLLLDYLGTFIEDCIRRHNLFRLNSDNGARQFLTEFLDGRFPEQQKIQETLHFLNWNPNDRYLCLRLETNQKNDQLYSSSATLNNIEMLIPESYAFLYQKGIVVIANLSFDDSSISDVVRSLAVLLREGLFKMGVSSEIHDFLLLPQGHIQACAALKLGEESGGTNWHHLFDDYILEYILTQSSYKLSPKLLASSKLLLLKKYDADNNTDFYHTLKVYLDMERNVLQTSKVLYIHRSTLFHRLERIRKIANVNLDDSKERLILQISFYLLE